MGVERRTTELWREFVTLKAYERWSIWLGHKTAIMPRFFQFRPWEVNLFTHYQLSCSSPLGIWPVEMGSQNVLVHCFAATLYFPVIILFFFSFCRSRSVIANFSIIGALGPWCPWLSFYCQFTIIFVFLFFIVPSGCHAMFELRIFTLCKKKRMESSAVFFSCSLEMVKKNSVG